MTDKRGRPKGTPNLSQNQIKKIVNMSEGSYNNTEIADEVGCSTRTVWKYQRKYDLVDGLKPINED